MTNDFIADLRIMSGKLNKFVKTIGGQVGAVVLENVDDNFRSQSFDGDKWPERAKPPARGKGRKGGAGEDNGRAILMMSGRLRRSFRMTSTGLVITVATDVPYAEVHNEGGQVTQTVTVTKKMRRFFWAMFKNTGDDKWKFMALSKSATIQRKFTMPKRQFIGENPTLDRNITFLLETELSMIFG